MRPDRTGSTIRSRPPMKLRPFYIAAAVVLAAMSAVSIWAWPQIPDDALVPIHWGPSGEPDGFASKSFGLFGLPAITAGLALLLAFLPQVEPRRQNLERSSGAYVAVGVATLVLMAAVHVVAVFSAWEMAVNVAAVASVVLSVLLCVIGLAMRRVHSTWLFGVRTPWTLTSERSWERTHRAASAVFLAVGVGSLITALAAGPAPALWVQLGGMGAGVAGLVAYSYLVWRDDPDRTESPTAG